MPLDPGLRDQFKHAEMRLRALILDDRLLLLLLAGFFLSLFVLRLDAYGPLLSLLTPVVALRLVIDRSIGIPPPRVPIIAFLLLVAVVSTSLLTTETATTTKALSRLGHMAVLALAITMLADCRLLTRLGPWFLGTGVLVHYLAWRLFQIPPMPSDTGGDPPPLSHFIAAFAVLAGPALAYWIRYPSPIVRTANGVETHSGLTDARARWWQAALVLLLLMDIDLLLHTESTPAFLGILVALIAVLVIAAGRRVQAMGLVLVALTMTLFWITDYAGIATEIGRQIENIANEERVQIWTDTWSMLKDNSLPEWLFGNGIGRFPQEFPQFSDPRYAAFVFPHNHALELLYETGIAGLLAAALLFLWPIWQLARVTHEEHAPRRRLLGAVILVTFLSWLILVYLVFPFFSKSTMYVFGILLGVTAVYLQGSATARRS